MKSTMARRSAAVDPQSIEHTDTSGKAGKIVKLRVRTGGRPKTERIGRAHTDFKRSLVKTITWRIIGSVDTFIIGYIATGQAKLGLAIAGTEVITKMVLYYLHERGWARVRWGLVNA